LRATAFRAGARFAAFLATGRARFAGDFFFAFVVFFAFLAAPRVAALGAEARFAAVRGRLDPPRLAAFFFRPDAFAALRLAMSSSFPYLDSCR
jgi:hypothetical protein